MSFLGTQLNIQTIITIRTRKRANLLWEKFFLPMNPSLRDNLLFVLIRLEILTLEGS